MFEIAIMIAFLLTVLTVLVYEAYWEHREEKQKEKQVARLARKAVEIYGDHIPEQIENYIKAVKNDG